MQTIWNWIKDNATGILAIGAVITALHLSLNSIHHPIDDSKT